ncbi:MAG: hypothetical protein R3F33_14575 [Planctomycetota bacterium]
MNPLLPACIALAGVLAPQAAPAPITHDPADLVGLHRRDPAVQALIERIQGRRDRMERNSLREAGIGLTFQGNYLRAVDVHTNEAAPGLFEQWPGGLTPETTLRSLPGSGWKQVNVNWGYAMSRDLAREVEGASIPGLSLTAYLEPTNKSLSRFEVKGEPSALWSATCAAVQAAAPLEKRPGHSWARPWANRFAPCRPHLAAQNRFTPERNSKPRRAA